MLKALKALVAAALIALGTVAPVALAFSAGCKATPQQVAYKTADAVVSSVDIAMRGWADYVVAERRRIAGLPAPEQGGPSAELLRRETRVEKAYGEYQQAIKKARDAVDLALEHNSLGHDDPIPSAVAIAARAVLESINPNR